MKKIISLAVLTLFFSCRSQEKIDLATLNLNEPIEKVSSFDDALRIGVETVEYPFSLLLEVEKSKKYRFDGIDLEGQRIIFQIDAEKLKTDSITRFGGGHIDLKPVKNIDELNAALKSYDAESKIYGIRIELKTPKLQTDILKKLEAKYGKGTKNPNTDHGLYWNVKAQNKFIFYAPDYSRLIILNNTDLSKSCYWDVMNGLIDFGGCNNEKYMADLMKNATKPEDVKEKPTIKIDKNWNINDLVVGKATEEDFVKSSTNKRFERMTEIDGMTGKTNEIYYQNNYHDFYFYFTASKGNPDNQRENFINGYAINDFRKVDISFENGLKPGLKFEEVLKLLEKLKIAYNPVDFANYIEIKTSPYKVTLNFNDSMLLSGMFVK
ncbi:hypothetical protein BWD42_01990 [Sphingobacterium sp. CZ-UAM]|uniref:hypothetical protein n=1 Tax=Sphingobacterium sp. CZ-UAM TaxID=1933868 RepID=UPI0009846BF6|nr:hypothetical protein [Sphingobacterium sp. CZ-UAM]OOG18757.1 hypothetical protein BWD42_01990 [Sphingobacterium sp. CZ-UAM]